MIFKFSLKKQRFLNALKFIRESVPSLRTFVKNTVLVSCRVRFFNCHEFLFTVSSAYFGSLLPFFEILHT